MLTRRFTTAFGAAALGVVLALGSVQGASALDKIRIGKSVPFAWAFTPVEVATQTGIWKKYGIEVTVTGFHGDAKMQQAMTAGSIDIGLGSGPGLGFMAKGVPAKGVAAFAGKPYSIGIVVGPDSDIKTTDQLKGRKVAVTTVGSLSYWLTTQLSLAEGWGPKGIQIVPLGGLAANRAALKTHEVDAITVGAEVGYAMEKAGQGRLIHVMDDAVKAFHTHVMFASDKLIKDNPELVQRIVNAFFEAIRYMRSHREEAVAISAAVLKQDKDVMEKTYDAQMRMLSDAGTFDPAAIAVLRKSFTEMGILKSVPENDELYTSKFVPAKPKG